MAFKASLTFLSDAAVRIVRDGLRVAERRPEIMRRRRDVRRMRALAGHAARRCRVLRARRLGIS